MNLREFARLSDIDLDFSEDRRQVWRLPRERRAIRLVRMVLIPVWIALAGCLGMLAFTLAYAVAISL